MWKYELDLLAEETELELHVCHMPPGASKWNKVEHRLFCYITNSKKNGSLVVDCEVDQNKHEKAINISDEQIENIDLERVGPYGDYAYIIRGFKKCK